MLGTGILFKLFYIFRYHCCLFAYG